MSLPPTTRARSRRVIGRGIAATVVAGLAVATLTTAGPALADGSTTVTLSANGANQNGRTLVLTDLTGTSLSTSSGLTASSGSTGFITGVSDNNYTNNGYTVQASMTNLYKKTGASTYDCADFIPSNDVSVAQNSALDLTNIAATVQPIFNLAGTILAGIPLPTGTPYQVTGIANGLSSTQLLGSGSAALATDGTLGGLPVKAFKGTSSTFTNPATFGLSSCGSATGASTPVLISGTANPGGVQGVLSTILGGTASAQSLITAGYTTLDAVKLAVAPLVTGGLGVLNSLGIGQITGVVNALKAITQTGTYKVSPTLNVTVPAAANGNYVGVMTVTLADV